MQSVEVDGENASGSVLTALCVLGQRLGLEITPSQLRRSFAFQQEEPSSQQLVGIAHEIGLEARVLEVSWNELAKLKSTFPAILRLSDGTALLLEGVREQDEKSQAVLLVRDPAAPNDAVVLIDQARMEAVWSGELVLIKRKFGVTDETQPFGVKWLAGQVVKERRLFIDIGAAALISTIFVLAPPFVFMIVIDRVLVNHSYSTLEVIAAALLIMMAFETILGHLRRLFTLVVTTRIDGRLNLYLLDKILKLPMDYFERNPTGQIMSKINRMGQIRQFLTGQLFGVFLNSVPMLGLIPVMLILQWRLALLVFALAGCIFAIVTAFLKPLRAKYHRIIVAERERGAYLVETIYGMRTIKSMALEGSRRYGWDRRVAEAMAARHAFGLLANYPQTISLPFERLMYSGSMVLGAYLALSAPNIINPGELVAFAMLSIRLGQPLIQIARLQQEVGEVRGGLYELASLVNAPPEEGRTGRGLRAPIEGRVRFQSVNFRYSPTAALALDDVSFEIPRGTMFGIMGRSGSGKTTITRLLQGLHRGYEGIIKIDGMDLREIDLDHLRTSIGVVAQENFLFRGSNSGKHRDGATAGEFSEVVRAAQLAGAEEFIERLPAGYDTYLEEGAVNLSGGQRQRLAIARALIIDPPVLVLDEATSALDAESEAIVNANLQRMASGRTIICVSHRLSMLVPADAIMVMERGKVYDIGRHEELLVRCDIYKHLWHQQNRYAERSAPHVPLVASSV